MDLVEVGVPRMEYIKGALLLVPDALSRRPDFKDKNAREGLKEAGVIDPDSDLLANPLSSAIATSDFPITPPAARPKESHTIDSWLAPAVETLTEAERALRAQQGLVALMHPKTFTAHHGMPDSPLDAGKTALTEEVAQSPTTEDPTSKGQAAQSPAADHSGENRRVIITRSKTAANQQAAATPAEGDDSSVPEGKPQPRSTVHRKPVRIARWKRLPPADNQDWRVRKAIFDKYSEQLGLFDVDACCDLGGQNRDVDRFWTHCLQERWRGLHVWCNPPYSSSHITVEAVLRKYIEEWRAYPEHTSTVFLLPDLQSRLPAWRKLFKQAGMKIIEVISTHDHKGEPNQTDAGFIQALRDEYERPGPLHELREKIKSVPHHCTPEFRLVGDVLWRTAVGHYQLVLGEDSPLREVVIHAHESASAGHTGQDKTLDECRGGFGGEMRQTTWATGLHHAQRAKLYARVLHSQMDS
ncbi:hypothetical protein CYMTET_39743 [Cymbomonas tetramitiformis]|uniref:Uncharacterized protein n=1 Tax=Cymbomonas tetramitiformis TaxID=36881 RepID=A0AAE0CAW8_9CHLO|nr:hypothetical protein CYMTET_39743 [Cymbomonas tetramitiformis]